MFSFLRRSGVLTLLCLATSFGFGASLSYTNGHVEFPTGGPGGLAATDMNRDGKIDLVYVHGTTLSVEFGAGNGSFGVPHDTALPGSEFTDLKTADMNGDGRPDVVLTEVQPMQVLVLLSNGDGTFQAPITMGLANTPYALQLGDIDNDGRVDIAVRECESASTGTCDVAILMGGGGGALTPSVVLSTPGASTLMHSLILTDLNRDGKLDVAVAELGGSSSAPTVSIAEFFGHGDGTFSAPKMTDVPITVPSDSVAVAPTFVAGDFNGDATDDIAVEVGSACGGSACGQAAMNVFLNNGAGGLTLHSSFTTVTYDGPSDWVAADLNNDLRTDLLRYNPGVHTGGILTWENNGSGTFTQVSNGDEGDTATFLQIRDINLDGRHDLNALDWDFGDSDLIVQTNNNGTPNCAPPPSGAIHAKICAPSGTSVSSTTFTIKASGNSPVGVKRMEIWIDGTKRAQALNDQIRKSVTLSAGSHKLTVVAVDRYEGVSKSSKTISVP